MKFKFSEDRMNEILEGIFSGEINELNLPEDLYNSFAKYYEKALYSGFGGLPDDFSGGKLDMLQDLRENVYMFSAAKTFNEVQELQGLKTDAQTLDEFTEAAKDTVKLWNDTRGFTEYVTASGNAQMASKWMDIQDKKDVLPMLTFSTDGNACDECEPFNNFSAPVDDPVWGWLTPLLHFNCHCILIQGEDTVQASDNYDEIAGMKKNVPEAFQFNPGADREVFSSKHPFFDVGEKYKEFAKQNFGLPIPEDVKQDVEETLTDFSWKDTKYFSRQMVEDLNNGELDNISQGVKDLLREWGDSSNNIRVLSDDDVRKRWLAMATTEGITDYKTIYRGEAYLKNDTEKVKEYQYYLNNYKAGKIIKFNEKTEQTYGNYDMRFISSSSDRNIALKNFGAISNDNVYSIVYVIKNETGVRGLNVQELTGFEGSHNEHEIIFGDKYSYEVIKTEEKNGNLFIELKQIGN